MKKILLVNKSFAVGGIQSSMINMANELSKYYEVDLFLYNPHGNMKDRLNASVKVLEPSWRFRCLGMTVKETIQTKKIKYIAFRLFSSVWSLPIRRWNSHCTRPSAGCWMCWSERSLPSV